MPGSMFMEPESGKSTKVLNMAKSLMLHFKTITLNRSLQICAWINVILGVRICYGFGAACVGIIIVGGGFCFRPFGMRQATDFKHNAFKI